MLDVNKKRYQTMMRSHTSTVTCAGLSPRGGHLVTGSADCTVRIWDLETMGQVGVVSNSVVQKLIELKVSFSALLNVDILTFFSCLNL